MLLSQVPAGRSVLSIKPFSMPAPAFTSRRHFDHHLEDLAASKLAAQAEGMSLGQEQVYSDSDEDSEVDQPLQQSNYF